MKINSIIYIFFLLKNINKSKIISISNSKIERTRENEKNSRKKQLFKPYIYISPIPNLTLIYFQTISFKIEISMYKLINK